MTAPSCVLTHPITFLHLFCYSLALVDSFNKHTSCPHYSLKRGNYHLNLYLSIKGGDFWMILPQRRTQTHPMNVSCHITAYQLQPDGFFFFFFGPCIMEWLFSLPTCKATEFQLSQWPPHLPLLIPSFLPLLSPLLPLRRFLQLEVPLR